MKLSDDYKKVLGGPTLVEMVIWFAGLVVIVLGCLWLHVEYLNYKADVYAKAVVKEIKESR